LLLAHKRKEGVLAGKAGGGYVAYLCSETFLRGVAVKKRECCSNGKSWGASKRGRKRRSNDDEEKGPVERTKKRKGLHRSIHMILKPLLILPGPASRCKGAKKEERKSYPTTKTCKKQGKRDYGRGASYWGRKRSNDFGASSLGKKGRDE